MKPSISEITEKRAIIMIILLLVAVFKSVCNSQSPNKNRSADFSSEIPCWKLICQYLDRIW